MRVSISFPSPPGTQMVDPEGPLRAPVSEIVGPWLWFDIKYAIEVQRSGTRSSLNSGLLLKNFK